MRWLAAAFLTASAFADDYRIQRTTSPITIDAKLSEPAWRDALPASEFIYNWFTGGDKEATEAKLLWDDDNLYVSWRCQDRHISAYETKKNGPVSKDDCVEIFISPNPRKVTNYYTFEINAIGTMLNRNRSDWWTGGPFWEPEGVRLHTTYHGLAKKDESADDRQWVVELAIPLKNFVKDAAHMPPQDGDEWRLNLMRTGGKTNAQQSTWSPINGEKHSFHTPENFGRVIFVAQNRPPAQAEAPQGRGQRGGQRGGGRGGFMSRPIDQKEAEAGRVVYNRSCTMCHGVDGAAGDRAPALGAGRRYLRTSEEDLFDSIKNGIKGTLMPASPLKDADVRSIVTYIRSLRATAIDVPVAGDVTRGREVFFGKGGCAKCHMVRGSGGLSGPDLSDIAGERKLDDLRVALVEQRPLPSRGWQPVTLKTKSGQTVRGIVKNENNFSLQVLGLDEKLHLYERSQLAKVDYDEKPLMPGGFDKKLSKEEFQDLLAFLSRQARRREQR